MLLSGLSLTGNKVLYYPTQWGEGQWSHGVRGLGCKWSPCRWPRRAPQAWRSGWQEVGGEQSPRGSPLGDRHCWPLLSGARSAAQAPPGWTDLSERCDQLKTDPHACCFFARSLPGAGPGAGMEARLGGGWSPLVSGRKQRPVPAWQTQTRLPPGPSGPASGRAGQGPDARRLDGDMEHRCASAWACTQGPRLVSPGEVGLDPAAVAELCGQTGRVRRRPSQPRA